MKKQGIDSFSMSSEYIREEIKSFREFTLVESITKCKYYSWEIILHGSLVSIHFASEALIVLFLDIISKSMYTVNNLEDRDSVSFWNKD